jgi:uncharacterized protein
MAPPKNIFTSAPMEIEVSRDHFTAYLHVKPGVHPTYEDVMRLLQAEKITAGIKDSEKIRLFLENTDLYDNTLIIASGKPFTLGTDAQIKYYFETDSRNEAEEDVAGRQKIDFRNVGSIVSVKAGDVIAAKVPAVQGEGGVTIYGQNLPGEWGMDVTLKAGENVKMSASGLEYIAEVGGAPIISKGTIRVDPIYIVDGDVDYSTGNITFHGTVAIRGSILDGFEVAASGDVIVENTIQSARVSAGGDVVVKRGILTREKGLVTADGNIYAKFIENATVECEGNVVVETAILNSRVYSNNRVIAMQNDGTIIGGRVIAFDRIICRNLGSTVHTTTIAQVGYRFEVQRKYLDGLARLHAVQKQIKEIQKNYEYVSAAKSEDMDRIGKLRGDMVKLVRIQDQMKEDLTELNNGRIFNQFAMVEVEQTIFPGVNILIGDIRHSVGKEATYASFKWDSDQKNIYLASFDESGQGALKSTSAKAKTVLIIDDSKAVRKTLRMILEKIGLKVLDEAEDGAIGVEKYKQLRPTLVTCDIMMVNMNGVETLREIRKENSKQRVVMISSIRDKSKILDCVMAGASDYILKPFVPSKVITVIKNVLES